MNEKILREAVIKQVTQEQIRQIPKADRIHFNEALDLRLGHKNILKIDLLTEFTSLVKLNLNNNLIQEIQGLGSLVNQKWLRKNNFLILHFVAGTGEKTRTKYKKMSPQSVRGNDSDIFVCVFWICHLTGSRKSRVWSLWASLMCLMCWMCWICPTTKSLIENMNTLENLSHFLIANNLLCQLDNVLYLKRFKKLFKVYITGNPVSKEDDYILFIVAYFPNSMCLDDMLINKETQSCEAELKLHKDAFVEFLNGSCLFDSMFTDDPEAQRLHCVLGVAPLLQTFEDQMVALCVHLFDVGLAEHKQRETELNSFFSGQSEGETQKQEKTSQVLAMFDEQHQESTMELQQLSDPHAFEVKINQHNDEITQFYESLLALEFELDSKLEDNIKKLDPSISDIVANFSETAKGIYPFIVFAQSRDLEDNCYQKMQEIAIAFLERVAKENLEEDMPHDVLMLFTDKNAVMDTLATSHDSHLLRISDRENQLVTRVSNWKVSLTKEIQEKGFQQNRKRISDIKRYVDHLRRQLNGVL
ncbi:LOW QUALITY PROTEIN: dynein regulatory complex subunit 3 [Odontesthes bonariensis]|uniref:LOW QUALITY PROTEIN: dynein regulatory complex subunit 3 n=1 Tax=Odontesthes bonariensis TaxID=219752 RepID=UPI003F58DAD6